MRLSRSSGLLVPVLLVLFTVGAAASRHETAGEFLKRHGIELTQDGLIGALTNPDPEIRDNAALQLVNQKATASAPAIKAALAAEKDLEMRVNLAYYLALLGDQDGLVALKRDCDSASASPRLKAALYLLSSFNDESCLNAVVSVLQSESESDHEHVTTALSLVPWFHNLSARDRQRLIALVIKQLGDTEPDIRLTASQILSKVEGSEAIPPLQKAIHDETVEVVRSRMQAELEALKARTAN